MNAKRECNSAAEPDLSVKQEKFTLKSFLVTLNRDLGLLFVSNLLWSAGYSLYSYLWPLYIKSLQADPTHIGEILSFGYFISTLVLMPGGFLADRYDRKKVIIVSWAISVPSPLVYFLAPHWVYLIPGIMLYYISLVGWPAIEAYVASSADKDKLASAFAFVDAAYPLGMIFSPVVGGILAVIIGLRNTFLVSFFLYAISTVILLRLRSQTIRKSKESTSNIQKISFRALFCNKKLLIFSLFFSIINFVLYLTPPFIILFIQDMGKLDYFWIGVIGSISAGGSVFFNFCFGKFGDRWGKMKAISVSLIIYLVSIVMLIVCEGMYYLFVAFFLLGSSYVVLSIMPSVIGALAPKAIAGKWYAVYLTMTGLAITLAPYFGGKLYTISPYFLFIITSMVTVVLSLLAISLESQETSSNKRHNQV